MSARDYLAAVQQRAEAQRAAHARMLELGGGVGLLGVRYPQMFEDMLAWDNSSENDHADTVLGLVAALTAALDLHRADSDGDCIACGVDTWEEAISWPCETVRAITGALTASGRGS